MRGRIRLYFARDCSTPCSITTKESSRCPALEDDPSKHFKRVMSNASRAAGEKAAGGGESCETDLPEPAAVPAADTASAPAAVAAAAAASDPLPAAAAAAESPSKPAPKSASKGAKQT